MSRFSDILYAGQLNRRKEADFSELGVIILL